MCASNNPCIFQWLIVRGAFSQRHYSRHFWKHEKNRVISTITWKGTLYLAQLSQFLACQTDAVLYFVHKSLSYFSNFFEPFPVVRRHHLRNYFRYRRLRKVDLRFKCAGKVFISALTGPILLTYLSYMNLLKKLRGIYSGTGYFFSKLLIVWYLAKKISSVNRKKLDWLCFVTGLYGATWKNETLTENRK